MSKQELISNSINKLFNISINNYIFVYTPPKVGSTTLVSSLRLSLGKNFNIIHIHDEVMLSVLTGITDVKINDIINYLLNNGKKIYVIDVYRTPIERKMSEFFEKISPYHFNNSEENINSYSIERIIDRFNKVFPHLENGDHYFDNYNIQNIISFDFENKYTIQEQNNAIYIKLRLCDSHLWSNILSKIFQTDIILITDYKTESKSIGQLYKKFKSEYKIPINFYNEIQNCKYLNFYYNEKERNNYLEAWKSKLTDKFIPYTHVEYIFYINLCLENQYINDIQHEHYIDNGCFCNLCKNKRTELYIKSKNGEINNEKIIHDVLVNNLHEIRNKKIFEIIKKKSQEIKSNKKFINNQFKIHYKLNK